MNIILVCTGNTCRSSMAEGIFKHMIKENSGIFVSSAGISAIEGEMANEKAIRVLKNKGIDISSHRARQLTSNMIKSADLILTMTSSHKSIINSYIESMQEGNIFCRVYTLKEYAMLVSDEKTNHNNLDIADPYGMDYNVYEYSMKEISEAVEKIIKYI